MIDVVAPINIALLKYWGKSCVLNVQPVADSISLTLSTDHLYSQTKITTKPGIEHSFSLNMCKKDLTQRMKDVLIVAQIRAMHAGNYSRFHSVCIASVNNFPTAAGLASSASGLASFAYGLSKLYNLDGDIASLARRGSGSACRSMFGGFVHWKTPSSSAAVSELTNSSCVEQLHPHTHWPDLRVLICVTNTQQKVISSSRAMQTTVETSPLFRLARRQAVAERLPLFKAALANRDFPSLANLTMRESNELHAACLDSWPPAIYLSETSYSIMNTVHTVNQYFGRTILAYTFDAGPNAFLLTLEKDAPIVLSIFSRCYGNDSSSPTNDAHITVDFSNNGCDVRPSKIPRFEAKMAASLKVTGLQYSEVDLSKHQNLLNLLPMHPGSIRFVISTQVGSGPQLKTSL